MKTVIVGCGRVGSVLADSFDRAGHQVIVLDTKTTAFDRLPGTVQAAPPSAATGPTRTPSAGPAPSRADVFMAMTEGDNRNVMSAQLATEALGARQVIAKINDPLRASAYAELGIATLCRTNLMAQAVNDFLGLGLRSVRVSPPPPGSIPAASTTARPRATEPTMTGPVVARGAAGVAGPADRTSWAVFPMPARSPRPASDPGRRPDGRRRPGEPTPAPVAPATAREG